MFLFRNNKIVYSVLGVLFLLGGCANAPFPELVDGDESTVEGEKTVLKESKSLASDQKNAAYEGDEIPAEDKVEAAKTKPVKKADSSFDDDEEVLDRTQKDFPELFGNKDSEKKYSSAEEETVPSVSYRMETFYFDNGSSVLSGKYNTQIRNIAKLAKQKNAIVNIYGYASSRTRNTDAVSHKLANFNISLQRAESVAQALRRAGVPAKQIQVEALSDTAPAYQEVMPEGERLNRRAEVYISY